MLQTESNPQASTRRLQRKCAKCGTTFDGIETTVGEIVLAQAACQKCVDERIAQEEKGLASKPRVDREAAWAVICPDVAFRTLAEGGETDPARLASECASIARILRHEHGPKGLILRGVTGRCKTRAMWRLMRRYFEAGKSIVALTSGRFSRQYQDAAGSYTLSPWFDRISTADAFFLDDWGKVPWTGNVWGQFFELIDERVKNHRPVFITMNEDKETLRAKCPDSETWEPLFRRLSENCKGITL